MKKEIDLTGLYCPTPILRTREEIAKIPIGWELVVKADDPAAEEDLRRWAVRAGQELVSVSKNGIELTVVIRRRK